MPYVSSGLFSVQFISHNFKIIQGDLCSVMCIGYCSVYVSSQFYRSERERLQIKTADKFEFNKKCNTRTTVGPETERIKGKLLIIYVSTSPGNSVIAK